MQMLFNSFFVEKNNASSITAVGCLIDIIVVVFGCSLDDLREHGTNLQVLHESAMFEHSAAPFKVASADLHSVATDAARWLIHVEVQAVNDALKLFIDLEGFLCLRQVELAEFDGAESERSWHFLCECLSEVIRVV